MCNMPYYWSFRKPAGVTPHSPRGKWTPVGIQVDYWELDVKHRKLSMQG